MVFSSLLFIFAFLPLCLAAYSLCKNNTARNIILLIFSLIFYTWGEPVYVLLLISMTFCDWLMAILLDKTKEQTARRLILFSACTINLGLIGVFKYTGFILTNVQNIFGIPGVIPKIILPIGISFYTFQLLLYILLHYVRTLYNITMYQNGSLCRYFQ